MGISLCVKATKLQISSRSTPLYFRFTLTGRVLDIALQAKCLILGGMLRCQIFVHWKSKAMLLVDGLYKLAGW